MNRLISISTIVLYSSFFCFLLWKILLPDEADWLQVKIQPQAIKNSHLNLEITLNKPADNLYLCVDLHWMGNDKTSRGYYSGNSPAIVTNVNSRYTFSFPIGETIPATYLFPVAYLSLDGTWGRRVQSAIADSIPVVSPGNGNEYQPLVKVRSRDSSAKQTNSIADSKPLRIAIALIWCVSAYFAMASRLNTRRGCMAIASLFSALWEIVNGSEISSGLVRSLAHSDGWYITRRGPQVLITIIVLVVIILMATYFLVSTRNRNNFHFWLPFSVYWGIVLMDTISLHEIDSMFSSRIVGFQSGQLIQLVGTIVCLISMIATPNSVHWSISSKSTSS